MASGRHVVTRPGTRRGLETSQVGSEEQFGHYLRERHARTASPAPASSSASAGAGRRPPPPREEHELRIHCEGMEVPINVANVRGNWTRWVRGSLLPYAASPSPPLAPSRAYLHLGGGWAHQSSARKAYATARMAEWCGAPPDGCAGCFPDEWVL